MKRIVIIGSGGSGKSVLARELGDILGIPVVHLDAVYWRPGWMEPPKEEWHNKVAELTRGDCWIIDGNYGGTMEVRFQAADTIVFLDLPRILCLWRVIKRRFQYLGRQRPDMAPGCPEKVDWMFLKWIWRYPTIQRLEVVELLNRYTHDRRMFRLRTAKDVIAFREQVRLAA